MGNFHGPPVAANRKEYRELIRIRRIWARGLAVGDLVWFAGESKPYRIQARSPRFLVCTKPFNLQKTVLYSIVDLDHGVRGTENLIFCEGFETQAQCREALARLVNGETEVSHRNYVEVVVPRTKKVICK